MIHTESSCKIYFGDSSDQLFSKDYLSWNDNLLQRTHFTPLIEFLDIQNLTFLHQVHGIEGIKIDKSNLYAPFSVDGDFLITNRIRFGLGVMSADCTPVVCVDKRNHAIGIAHAGWRGAINGVVIAMLDRMKHAYGTNHQNIKLFFGPSVQQCCYEVSPDFKEKLKAYSFGSSCIIKQEKGYFFDLHRFLIKQLQLRGISENSIDRTYALCTICNSRFWSHRRGTKEGSPERIGRQMTVVTLA